MTGQTEELHDNAKIGNFIKSFCFLSEFLMSNCFEIQFDFNFHHIPSGNPCQKIVTFICSRI